MLGTQKYMHFFRALILTPEADINEFFYHIRFKSAQVQLYLDWSAANINWGT